MKQLKTICVCFVMLLWAALSSTVQGQDPSGTVLLNSGYEMPLFGIDCSAFPAARAEELVYTALREGFRSLQLHAGTAVEEAVGRGIRRAIEDGLISREDLFLSAVFSAVERENVSLLIQNTLTRLGVNYLDLMTERQSAYDKDASGWQAMEQASEAGLIRSLGMAGFSDVRNVDLFLDTAVTFQPAVLQLRVYPYEQRTDMKEHLAESGIVLTAEDPLGGNGEEQILFADSAVSVAATWHQKTSAQIILRWQLQSGNVVMLSPENEAEIAEYADILNFSLNADEMAQIDALDRQQTLIDFESEEVAPVEEWF